jgi:hypothetical protein
MVEKIYRLVLERLLWPRLGVKVAIVYATVLW